MILFSFKYVNGVSCSDGTCFCTGETWKATAVNNTKNSFSAKVKLACYKSQDVFTHTPVSYTLVWINEVWFLDTTKKTSKPKYVTTNHMRRLFGQIQETQEQVAVFSTGGELETPFIFIWKNILHVCALPHSQNTKSMPGYRKTFSSHLKYSPQIML